MTPGMNLRVIPIPYMVIFVKPKIDYFLVAMILLILVCLSGIGSGQYQNQPCDTQQPNQHKPIT